MPITVARPAQRNAAVPPAVRPGRPGAKRTLCGCTLLLLSEWNVIHPGQVDHAQIDPQASTISMAPMTWSRIKNSNAALQALVHEKAEAVRTMQTRMVDLSMYAAPTVPTNRPKPVVAPTGIKALCADIQHLVADMAAPDVTDPAAITDMARRYGKLRDAMADLRAAFSEAEGQFDVAQALLLQKMGADE